MNPITRLGAAAAGALLATALWAAPAAAFEPPGHGAGGNFGCVAGEDNAVAGHPGAAGLAGEGGATARVRDLTGDPMPTAWNAVEHAEPIELGTCDD